MNIDVNAISDGLEACRCTQLGDALDDAGETFADYTIQLAEAEVEIGRLANELDLARGVAQALGDCLRDVLRERDGLRLERDAAHLEVAGLHARFGVVA